MYSPHFNILGGRETRDRDSVHYSYYVDSIVKVVPLCYTSLKALADAELRPSFLSLASTSQNADTLFYTAA